MDSTCNIEMSTCDSCLKTNTLECQTSEPASISIKDKNSKEFYHSDCLLFPAMARLFQETNCDLKEDCKVLSFEESFKLAKELYLDVFEFVRKLLRTKKHLPSLVYQEPEVAIKWERSVCPICCDSLTGFPEGYRLWGHLMSVHIRIYTT